MVVSQVVTVLGDAAHPMSPFKGQGANTALADATALAGWLRRLNGNIRPALACAERELIARSSKRVSASRVAARCDRYSPLFSRCSHSTIHL